MSDNFWMPHSPLDGKPVPADWKILDLNGKRTALIRTHIAADWQSACRLLSRHGAAVRKYRRTKKHR